MPKLPPVTDKDIADVVQAGQDVQHMASNLERRLRTSILGEKITSPCAAAVAAQSIAMQFAELASALMTRAALEEMKIATRKDLEQRQ